METERLQALICAIEEGSFTAVSDKLGYTTSGISRMMAALEKEAGFPLLVRGRNGVKPTEECRQLLPIMREILDATERYDQLAGQIAGISRGTIRIGTSYYAYYDWFARMIADFGKAYPNIEVQIIEGTSTELLQAMEEHRADLCIISRREGDFDWIPLQEDELLACLPEDHPMAGNHHQRTEKNPSRFPVSGFESADFIELYPGKDTDNSRMFASCGVTPQVKYTTSDNYAAYAMVAAGLGITCTNAIIGEAFKEGVVYLPLDPPQKVEIGMALPRAGKMSPAAGKFADFIKSGVPANRC